AFDDEANSQVIRCYLDGPLKRTSSNAYINYFNYPEENSDLSELYAAIKDHITVPLYCLIASPRESTVLKRFLWLYDLIGPRYKNLKSITRKMATPKSSVTTAQNDDIPSLKAKITELERQNAEYKTKLDELRRAKATTMVKVEKEYVNAS
ncbi:unnamed protein product, partial [Didymodactylos carnosus]